MPQRSTCQKIEDLEARRARIEAGGGAARIQQQHAAGKRTARERLAALFDPDSFEERGAFVSHHSHDMGMCDKAIPGDGVITGSGLVDGRPVCAFAQDFTCMGGSVGEMHAAKIVAIMEEAVRVGVPVVGINDSGGARIQEGVGALTGYGRIFYTNTLLSGVVPQISIIAGPCAGGAVYSPAITDFVIMVRGTARMFITGPEVIRSVTGEDVTAEALGGADTHAAVSGNVHFVAEDDAHALRIARTLLALLPANNAQAPPEVAATTVAVPDDPTLDTIIPDDPRAPFDVKAVIHRVTDPESFLEVQADYARNIVVGLARIGGTTVGVLANQPAVLAGVLDIDASDKAARFVRFCNAFNVPLVTFVDVPGFLPGVGQELGGIIRHGAKLLFAYSAATVPKVTVILRKAYGGAYIGMCSKPLGADRVFAWPTAEIAVMGAEGAVRVLYRKEIEEAADPEAAYAERVAAYREQFYTPYAAAAAGVLDDVIAPRTTRRRVLQALELFHDKRERRPPKKHGNIPL